MINQILNIFLLFVIYSVFGWILEVFAVGIGTKKFVNRGFLIGPYCPIYGTGSILMVLMLNKYKGDYLALFVLGATVCSILEYLTSYIMEKLFKARWWDYSNDKFNINGRICLRNAVAFGVLGTVLVEFVNPFIQSLILKLSMPIYYILCAVLFVIFVTDVSISFNVMNKVKTFAFEARKDNTVEITMKVKQMLQERGFLTKRLLKAYPNLVSLVKSKKEEIVRKKEEAVTFVKEKVEEVKEEIETKVKLKKM